MLKSVECSRAQLFNLKECGCTQPITVSVPSHCKLTRCADGQPLELAGYGGRFVTEDAFPAELVCAGVRPAASEGVLHACCVMCFLIQCKLQVFGFVASPEVE